MRYKHASFEKNSFVYQTKEFFMATQKGLEPSTSAVTGQHSNQTELLGHNISYQNNGGNYRARTYDPLLVRQMLSQLS